MPTEPNLIDGQPWTFDAEVAEAFDDMLDRSIPGYRSMRGTVTMVVADWITEHARGPIIDLLDLGCSRGSAIAEILDATANLPGRPDVEAVGIDVSEAMLAEAAARFADDPRVSFVPGDLRDLDLPPSDVILAILTLQFVPAEDRQALIAKIAETLRPGGLVVVVEKTLGTHAAATVDLDRIYYRHKALHRYTPAEIDAKRRALSGVMVPWTASATVEAFAAEGIRLEPVWRTLQFAGWYATR